MILVLAGLLACTGPNTSPNPSVSQSTEANGVVVVPSEGLEVDLAVSQAFFASRPRYERPLDVGLKTPPVVPNMSAESCGVCHQEIYQEWKTSVHAQAWVDPQYQSEITKSGNRWMCLNCHTPLMSQQDRWPRDLIEGDIERPILADNPIFDAKLRDEGITCTACHVRDGVIHGPGLANSKAPHPVQSNPDFRSSELCIRCHQATARYEGKNFVCTFDTAKEWQDGPYPEEEKDCISCHMPRTDRPAGLGGPTRSVAQHWWRGAGIPKQVDGPYPPPEANPAGLHLSATTKAGKLIVHMENRFAGHALPTGDPERWVQVDVAFFDQDGGRLEGAWQHRLGQVWEWEPIPKKLSDNRLGPREVRKRAVPIPANARRATVSGSSHRMSEENASYHHLLGTYPISVVTHSLEVALP